jgi:hypothetical protein
MAMAARMISTARRFAAWLAMLALLLEIVAPAFATASTSRAEVLRTFPDAQICSAHVPEAVGQGKGSAFDLCPLCLLLGHHGAFAPTAEEAVAPQRLAALSVAVAIETAPQSTHTAGFHARAPPALA